MPLMLPGNPPVLVSAVEFHIASGLGWEEAVAPFPDTQKTETDMYPFLSHFSALYHMLLAQIKILSCTHGKVNSLFC